MLLKLAKERGVTGVAKWFHYEQVAIDGSLDTIESLRKGMKFGPPRKLSIKASWVEHCRSPAERIQEREVVSEEDLGAA